MATITHEAYALANDIKRVMDSLPQFMLHRDHKRVHLLAQRAFAAGFVDTCQAIHRAGRKQIGDDVRIALGEAALALVEA